MRTSGLSCLSRRCFLGGAALAATGLAPPPDPRGNAVGSAPIRLAGLAAPRPPPPLPPPISLPMRARMTEADRTEWLAFKRRFVAEDGRVVDTGNSGHSHSEGQGWGLFFAVAFDDAEAFDRILAWTARHLRRPSDSLHAWRYLAGAANPVPDLNNATDGDLFIAASLGRAARAWGRPDHAQAAACIARDVLRALVCEAGGRTLLLPGAQGFAKADAVVVNPSYYAFALFPELAALAPSPLWGRLRDDGLRLIAEGRFGQWRLPPDWLLVSTRDGRLAPAPSWPARFSYDAVRVPLHLAWSRLMVPELARDFASYWAAPQGHSPAWIDLRTGETAGYAAPPGIVAISRVATQNGQVDLPRGFPAVKNASDYYSAALVVLARIAWRESRQA